MNEGEIHYYAGWPGRKLCSSPFSFPIMPITSIRYDAVTCPECLAILKKETKPWQFEPSDSRNFPEFEDRLKR